MLIKLLGVIDVIAGIMLIFSLNLGIINPGFLFFGFVVLTKSAFGMLKDFASWIDFLAGVVLLLSAAIEVPFAISLISGVLIFQKGVFSFF